MSPSHRSEAGGPLNEGTRATEIADQALLDKLRARGFTIDQSAEIQQYLDYRKANAASFLENDLLLRPEARKIGSSRGIPSQRSKAGGVDGDADALADGDPRQGVHAPPSEVARHLRR